MGRARRKPHSRGEILEGALAVAEARGWDAVTIRAIAERIEFSPTSIYEHFAAKRDILHEVALRGMDALSEALAPDLCAPSDSRLEQLAERAWAWAFANPMLFQLIYAGGVGDLGIGAESVEAQAVVARVRDAVAAATPAGFHDRLEDLTDVMMAALSGLIILTMFDRVPGGRPRAERLRAHLVADFRLAWGAGRPAMADHG
jgi:AcrR family transcriptional regulator